MSELGTINIEKRTTVNSRASKKLRKNGYVPASLSCRGKESISVAVKTDELKKSLSSHGRNALFKLSLENDNSITGMVKDIQYSPIKREMLHVDFQQVSLNEEIRVDLDVRLKGVESLEFKELMALSQMDVIRVKGLPQNIPDNIVIDVSNINGVGNINVADLNFPEEIVPELDPDQCVISIVEIKRPAIDEESETEVEAETETEAEVKAEDVATEKESIK